MAINEINNIERLEVMEERFGINIDNVTAYIEIEDDDNSANISIIGEINARDNPKINVDFNIIINAYDEKGKIIGTTMDYVNSDEFFGIYTFSENIYNVIEVPSKIRIYPQG